MKVLILTKYGENGASSRYRFYNYFKYLDEAGISYEVKPLLDDNYVQTLYGQKTGNLKLLQLKATFNRIHYLLKQGNKFDLLFIEKELFPYLPYSIERFFLKGKKYLLDYDDYVGASYQSGILKYFLANKIQNLVKKAKSVSVGNHWYFMEFKTDNLIYIPTVIDLEKYPDYNLNPAEKTIVWIGSPSTVSYLKLIEQPLIQLSNKHDFTLKIIGGFVDLDPRIKTEVLKWSAAEENRMIAYSSIGIMPLRKTLWEFGKCGFKLIQYLASGIPVVASDLPANEEIVSEDVGKIAKNTDKWLNCLDYFLSNPELARRYGQNGRKRVEEKYSYQIWGPIFANYLKSNLQ